MTWTEVIWTEGPDGNIRHMAEHGVIPDEVEHVLANPIESDMSESSGRPILIRVHRGRPVSGGGVRPD